LGCEENILIDTITVDVKEKDIFVLCTDGLTNMLKEDEILDVIMKNDDPEVSCSELVRLANEKAAKTTLRLL